jgi:2-polyprenyl-3-methyl-5-hydroxy-6-metoxy-1,4-benzoquinol methylase
MPDNATYCLPPGYRSRPANNAGLKVTDGAQRRVYEYAARLASRDAQVRTVLDWGCGSGSKLVEFFQGYDTLGVDVCYRLATLRQRFPSRRWEMVPVPAEADLILCIDVIEHVENPLTLLGHFRSGNWRHLVIATPERELVARKKYRAQARRQQRRGPPMNRWHAREWTDDEFAQLLTREFQQTPQITVLGRWNLVAHLRR